MQLEDLFFEIPDDWRDQSTYVFHARDGGTLVVEPSNEGVDGETLFESALAAHLDAWEPLIIYSNRMTFARGNGTDASGAEGEQSSMAKASRLRFALAGMSFGAQAAALRFLMPSHPNFIGLVRQVVASAVFSGEPWAPPLPSPGQRTAHAGSLALHVPIDWAVPSTLEFLDPDWDSVVLTVTVAEPMAAPGSIDWAKVIGGTFRVVDEQERPIVVAAPQHGWEVEWTLRLGAAQTPWIVRKSCVQATPRSVLTAVGQAPENLRPRLEAGWTRLQRTLRVASGA